MSWLMSRGSRPGPHNMKPCAQRTGRYAAPLSVPHARVGDDELGEPDALRRSSGESVYTGMTWFRATHQARCGILASRELQAPAQPAGEPGIVFGDLSKRLFQIFAITSKLRGDLHHELMYQGVKRANREDQRHADGLDPVWWTHGQAACAV